MNACRISLQGVVQGLGFRPLIYRIASEQNLNGWVCNQSGGLIIHLNHPESHAINLLNNLKHCIPTGGYISKESIDLTAFEPNLSGFEIRKSTSGFLPGMQITPDLGLCEDCKNELRTENNKRYKYPFVTCTQCGPRYSILTKQPYDREHTSMSEYRMCPDCQQEYKLPQDKRFHSQTNSCPTCSIDLALYQGPEERISSNYKEAIGIVVSQIKMGQTIAIKGIGGYLLICDASNRQAINQLRQTKNRPTKPFALLYPSLELVHQHLHCKEAEERALISLEAPIVLLKQKSSASVLAIDAIAPGLTTLGVMLPYSPLLQMLCDELQMPLVATSANLSQSPILYSDAEALKYCFNFASLVLCFKRDIQSPQDDSVLRFTKEGRRIFLRRSRGFAPNFFQDKPFKSLGKVLAIGAELKSSLGFHTGQSLFISQYLGSAGTMDWEKSVKACCQQLGKLLEFKPEQIVCDLHPGYHSTAYAESLATRLGIPCVHVPHHQAHAAAVLGENALLESHEPVLCFSWDGTGFGEGNLILGSEVYVYEQASFKEFARLKPFKMVLGDKMSREPRISALSLNNDSKELKRAFSANEWSFYSRLFEKEQNYNCSSMGRFLDAAAFHLLGIPINTYEAEASIKLEQLAAESKDTSWKPLQLETTCNQLNPGALIQEIVCSLAQNVPAERIALSLFQSLVEWIKKLAFDSGIKQLAFSGGVFQNSLFVQMLEVELAADYRLYFHKQLSPNDECISYGQLCWLHIHNLSKTSKIHHNVFSHTR